MRRRHVDALKFRPGQQWYKLINYLKFNIEANFRV